MISVDLAVIGAGPAGLTAATLAAEGGLRIALIDMNARPGGQYWRHGQNTTHPIGLHQSAMLDNRLTRLAAEVSRGRITPLMGYHVWVASAPTVPGEPFILRTTPTCDPASEPVQVEAQRLLIATGAYDRQLPIPGWTLPGVVAAGGAQALLKEHGQLVGQRVVVAGTGPFLLSVGAGLAQGGAHVAAVCEYHSPLRWLQTPAGAVSEPGKAREGIEYAEIFVRQRIPYLPRHTVVRIHGETHVEGVTIARVALDGSLHDHRYLEADAVALGWGFTPQVELPVALGAQTHVDVDGSLVVTTDRAQRASIPALYIAGEATGVGGATKAVIEGELAALTVLHDSGENVAEKRVHDLQRAVRRAQRFARALHNASALPATLDELISNDAIVCRCEEVQAATVREAVAELDATRPRDGKITTRAGLGWCQGRECALAVSCLTMGTDTRKWDADALRATQKRPLATPVSLGALSMMDADMASTAQGEK